MTVYKDIPEKENIIIPKLMSDLISKKDSSELSHLIKPVGAHSLVSGKGTSFKGTIEIGPIKKLDVPKEELSKKELTGDSERLFSLAQKNAESELENYKKHSQRTIDAEIDSYKAARLKQIEKERQELLNKAYEEGLKKAKKEAETELQKKAEEILATINEAVKAKNTLLKEAKQEILQLGLKVAQQIVKTEISLNQEACNTIILEALNRVTDKDRVIIRVNKSDAEMVRGNLDHLLTLMPDIKKLEVQEDSRIEQGGCIIETKLGYVDATLTTKLSLIEKVLLRVYEEEKEGIL